VTRPAARPQPSRAARAAAAIEQALDLLLAAMLAALVASLAWQVFGRYVLDRAPSWSEELARFLMVWITMLGAAAVTRGHGHIAVTTLPDALGPSLRRALGAVRDLVVLAVAFVVGIEGAALADLLSFQASPAFEVTMAVPYAALPAGSALIALMVVLRRLAGEA
jgi:TRAP-type C4-dicarboxylate transport system permease small subunit